MFFVKPTKEELAICHNSNKENQKNSEEKNYFNIICNKPWGKEYFIYQNKNIGIWILHINKNEKTSLHSHFKKDSLLIPVKGTFKIELFSTFKILNELDMLYIPKKTFHGLCSYNDDSIILEIEIYSDKINYTDKNDLLRLKDKYNRDRHSYENSVREESMNENNLKNLHTINEINYKDTTIKLSNNIENIHNNSQLVIMVNGKIFNNNNILSSPSIIDLKDNISYLTNECSFLSFKNNYIKENSKIIYSKKHLEDLLKIKKFKNIGLTSGCFDILHIGHYNNLKECKNNCEILFICLSSDKQIKELKGNERPINSIEDRIRLLTTMNCIDYIILYDEIDNYNEKELDNIINILNPSVWFKGSDYNVNDIKKKHPQLKKIILFDNIKNKSTTNIINKIKI